ncbi:type I-C CRISPR-associated protein Cas7/Csd2 [Lonepinella sp. BR2930]|uniref:type I-C CRISPR-associated protein Cas7/Csd2 n=1 Tax=Lonepinella sp. BR2930 TaxID=3434554 RepID=UPI003F6DD394
MSIQNRYEFVYFFDVTNGNPNGDPDAGNLPRLDPESSKGLVTDVCLKRKIRNYIELANPNQPGYEIYVKDKGVLNLQNKRAYEALGIESEAKKLPKDEAKAHDITAWMCKNFFDIRSFGAVMTTEVNSGQVRGPVQLAFAQSIDPIIPLEISITRMAVTNEKDLEKERTMGRKYIVPYALYRVHGFISAHLAAKTGFGDDDLKQLWDALKLMFEHDRSATRGEMAARKLIVFKHDSMLGSESAHKLFDTVKVERIHGTNGTPAAAFSNYKISVDSASLNGINVEELL